MKNKYAILGLIFLLIGFASGEILTPSSVTHTQDHNTTNTYSFEIENTLNVSESVNIQLTGGEILDLTSDFPKDISVPASTNRTVLYTLNTHGKSAKNMSGVMSFYYSSEKHIDFDVEVLGPAETAPPEPDPEPENKTLVITLIAGRIAPDSRVYFEVTDENRYPISGGKLLIDAGNPVEIDIGSDGLAKFDAPSSVTCPAMVRASKSGYISATRIYESPYCVSTTQPSETGGTIKFYHVRYENSIQQGAKITETFYIKNYGDCEIELIGIQYDKTRFTLSGLRVPIRVVGTYAKTLQPGSRTSLNVEIDAREMDPGIYSPTLWMIGEDCGGSEARDSLPFSITVLKGIRANVTQGELEISIYNENEVGNEARVRIRVDGDEIEDAKVKITFPDGSIITKETDDDGEVEFTITDVGDYKIKASKSGYTTATEEFNVEGEHTYELSIDLGEIMYSKTLEIFIKSDNRSISSAKVQIILPNGKSRDFTSSYTGKVTMILDMLGDYSVRATKAGYFPVEQSFSVALKPAEISVEGKQELDSTITLSLLSEGSPLVNTIIHKTAPDNYTTSLLTPSNGKVTVHLNLVGKYTFFVNKTGYVVVRKIIDISKKKFTLSYDEKELVKGNNLLITAKEGDSSLSGVDVEITLPDNDIITKSTTSSGQISLPLEQVGTYTLIATKSGYDDVSLEFPAVVPTMTLEPIYHNENDVPTESPICGGTISAKVTVGDDVLSGVTMKLTKPDETIISLVGRELIFFEGQYKITAQKEGYEDASATFSITCPVTLIIPPKDITMDDNITFQFSKKIDATLQCGSTAKASLYVGSDGVVSVKPVDTGVCTLEWSGGMVQFTVKEKGGIIAGFSSWIGANIWYLSFVLLIVAILLALYWRKQHATPSSSGESFDKEMRK